MRTYSKNGKWCAYAKQMRSGYWLIRQPYHPFADMHGYIKRSRAVVESVLKCIFPKQATFHHIDHNTENDFPSNIIVFENTAEHSRFHVRERAYKACGHANWRKCGYCHEYDNPAKMYITPNGENAWHQKCQNRYRRRKQLYQSGPR